MDYLIIWITRLNLERTRSGGDPKYDYNHILSNSVIFYTLTRVFHVKMTKYGSFQVRMASIKSTWPLKLERNGQMWSQTTTITFKGQRLKISKRFIRKYLKLFLNLQCSLIFFLLLALRMKADPHDLQG